jgi:hypothetical protein
MHINVLSCEEQKGVWKAYKKTVLGVCRAIHSIKKYDIFCSSFLFVNILS